MKQTVKELFSPEERWVYLSMMWTGRGETPEQVAGRAWETSSGLVNAVPDGDTCYPDAVWAGSGDVNSNQFVPISQTLQDLEQRARDSLETGGKGGPDTLVTLGASLMSPGPNGTGIASYAVSAGKPHSHSQHRHYPVQARLSPGHPGRGVRAFSQHSRDLEAGLWHVDHVPYVPANP